MRKYIIGSGYVHNPDDKDNIKFKKNFFSLWYNNTIEYSSPEEIIVLNSNAEDLSDNYSNIKFLNLSDNPGHILHHLGKSKKSTACNWENAPYLCGWSFSIIYTSLYAYFKDFDFIYKEQDCLAFGNWVSKLYNELGNRKMVTGTSKHMSVEQSLFLIKNDYILDFTYKYLSILKSDKNMLPENKFKYLIENNNEIGFFNMPYGRDKPIDTNNLPFYLQHHNKKSNQKLKKSKLIKEIV